MELYVYAIYGGVSYTKQFRALERGVDILVACPGRLIDLLDRGSLSLEDTGIVVLDEADRMADMGFMEPVCKILDECKKDRQTILFSATLDDEVAELVRDYQTNPVTIEVGPEEVSIESMDHHFWLMPNSKKSTISSEIIRKCGRTIVFCRTRAGVDRVGEDLEYDGLGIETLHGGLSQRQRDGAMKRFQYGECMALVATDVAARGIDVEGVNCVIHYDPPENAKAYKHRSGRTARGGASGIVVSLVQKPQKKSYGRIQREVGIKVDFKPPEFVDLPEFEVEFIAPRKRQSYGSRNRNDRNQGHYGQRNQSSFGNNRGGGGRGGGGRGGGGRGGGGRGGGGRGGGGRGGGGRGGKGRSKDSQGNNSNDSGGANKSYRGEARGQNYQPSKKSRQGYQGGRSEGRGNNRGRGRSNRGQRGNRN
jgi:superfamily II DNA/RNA helicase